VSEVADAQYVEWTDINTDSAAFIGDAFLVIDDDWDTRKTLRQWHF